MDSELITKSFVSIISKTKQYVPKSKWYHFCFLFFKFQGILIISNSFGFDKQSNTENNPFLRTFTIFSYFTFSNNYEQYKFVCLLLCLLLFTPFILLILIMYLTTRPQSKRNKLAKNCISNEAVYFLSTNKKIQEYLTEII